MKKRTRFWPACCAGLGLAMGCAGAGPAGDMEESPPAATRPAATQPAESPGAIPGAIPGAATRPAELPGADAVAWVEKIDKAGRDIHGLTAKVKYVYVQGAMSDRQVRHGVLQYEAGPPAKFRADFTDFIVAGRDIPRSHLTFIFDGQWLVERHEEDKQFIKRQIVPPNAPPGEADPLTRGRGPFPLPITLHKDDLLSRFVVTVAGAGKDDPEGAATIHLHLRPRAGKADHLTGIDLWYDKKTLLPVKATSVDDAENESSVTLTDVELNPKIKDGTFDTGSPGVGWNVEVKPWGE